ncbi:MAG TPA: BrnT family toxin [Terriglobia bacterium]|nr:BrnT family toxin [Terriglobia bacterium]
MVDDRFDYGETRFVTLGLLQGRVVVISHTETDEVIRIISVRKATKNEEIGYFRKIAD